MIYRFTEVLNDLVNYFLLGDILLLEDWKQANHLSDDLAMEFTTNESGDRIFAEGIVIPMTGIENYPYTILFNLSGDRPELCKERNRLQLRKSGYSLKVDHNNRRFSSYWNSDNNMTYPLILAKIPVKNPWEIFAYLPFGGWNECPNTPELMAVAKYWFEQHGAVPAAMSHDELEFLLPAPVPEEKAMDAAVELYGFCPDVIDQGPEDATVGALADVLRQSTVWYFWWD